MSFWAGLEGHGERVALVDDQGRALTYAELAGRADRALAPLDGRRLLFLRCDATPATVIAYLGCLRAGHVVALLDGGLDAGLLARLEALYRPHALLQPAADGLSVEIQWRAREGSVALHPDLGLLLSTSGTTGSPKLVRLSPANLEANARSIVDYLHLSTEERPLASLPLHYSYGLSVLNSHLAAGATLLLSGHTPMQREFWARVREERASSLAGVPYHYEMLERLRFERMALPALQTLTQAGGRLAAPLVEKYARLGQAKGFRFYVMYGQTEATARIAYLPPELAAQQADAIGRPIPGGDWWLESADGQRLDAPGEEGELVYRGPNVMLGYAEGATDLALPDQLGGVLHTGDLAVLDDQGLARITGRRKRMIKVFGNRVGLDELERFLQDSGFAAHCLGEDDRIRVVITDAALAEPASRALVDRFGFHPSVIETRVLDALPLQPSGKVDYHALADRLAES